MGTVKLEPGLRTRHDHIFFQVLAALAVVAVFVGFAPTYFLPGVFQLPAWKSALGPPHPLTVHIHGAIFTAWVLLLLVQTSLTGAGRVDLHRRLGLLGFLLACLLVLAGVAVTCENLARRAPPGDPRLGERAIQVWRILGFALLTYFGCRQRRNPRVHKRLMLIATIVLLPAPLVRWPVLIEGNFPLALGCCYALLVLMACYDWWSTGQVAAATLWGSATMIVTNPPIVSAFAHNAVWLRVATHMQALGHFLR